MQFYAAGRSCSNFFSRYDPLGSCLVWPVPLVRLEASLVIRPPIGWFRPLPSSLGGSEATKGPELSLALEDFDIFWRYNYTEHHNTLTNHPQICYCLHFLSKNRQPRREYPAILSGRSYPFTQYPDAYTVKYNTQNSYITNFFLFISSLSLEPDPCLRPAVSPLLTSNFFSVDTS